ncbi:MAG TPA: fumarylacetoacetate hydrolase family protein [Egicoccus sp.]|nr:fumarylacetoacetate hydrolase family protein [Egicoccus sp.]HSK22025.1 fumarylacetoacetate hydrolase family protein [Egicoccus sp.]
MRIVGFDGGFGVVEDDDTVAVMSGDIGQFLAAPHPPGDGEPRRPLRELRLTAPVTRPEKIICIGLNYRDHAAETGKPVPTEPIMFAKFANSLVGDGATVAVPAIVEDLDWEAELAVVIGRGGRDIPRERALDHVAGYSCSNDLSARVLQRRGGQWTRGKAIDGFLPMGPWLVTRDEVPDPQDLRIRCEVNGDTVQDSSTSQMVFGVAELIAEISRTMTLAPGDIICTGTPPGVGLGMDPPRFLHEGDEVVVSIEGLGSLHTRIGGTG